MSAIVTAASAVFQALISPFSPNRRNRGNVGDDGEEVVERGGDTVVRRLLTTTTTTITEIHSGQKRKRDDNKSKSKTAAKKSTTHWGGLTREAKATMTADELCRHFQKSLENLTACGNQKCKCLDVLQCRQTCFLVANYLEWFERKPKLDQDCILVDWYKYAAAGGGKKNWYMLPFRGESHTGGNNDSTDANIDFIIGKKVCQLGIQKVMHIGNSRFNYLRTASKTLGVPQPHKSTGKIAHYFIDAEREKHLKEHFERLLQLGEVRATRVIATVVDGEQGHANREDTVDMVYLPTSFGFRPCYRRYMENAGYNVTCRPNGGVVVGGINGKEINRKEFVSFATYCRFWKKNYPQLKVSHPVEDICQYCFVFANRHRYLANHSAMNVCTECDEDGDGVEVVRPLALNDGTILEADCCNENDDDRSNATTIVPVLNPESAATTVAEEREVLLLECAVHVKMARVQRSLYQEKITNAIADAQAGVAHTSRRYTFVVDYGQNMELPVYNTQQPGCTYYYSPLSVYNLGMVNHAHEYEDGTIKEHMYAHVYHEGVGKKGANNVASLIVKTLRRLYLLQDDSVGGELNIIFDNCSGQNKNNTVLKLAMLLKAAGYFTSVNFIFLIVGHTKNAADRLFNSLKHEYRKKNLYTMEDLIRSLDVSNSVTVIPTVPEDFNNYDAFCKDLFRDLTSKVKQNHIFACSEHDRMSLRESNMVEHKISNHKCSKKGRLTSAAELKRQLSDNLTKVECVGINPYKQVEMHFKYGPQVPEDKRKDLLYCEPDSKVMSLVKVERSERSVFRAKLKETKRAGMKERLENIAYFDDNGNEEHCVAVDDEVVEAE